MTVVDKLTLLSMFWTLEAKGVVRLLRPILPIFLIFMQYFRSMHVPNNFWKSSLEIPPDRLAKSYAVDKWP